MNRSHQKRMPGGTRPSIRAAESLDVTSSAFGQGQRIPTDHTADGADISPPLDWTNVPDRTRSVAVLCEDPDVSEAEPFVHWILCNLRPYEMGLPVTRIPEGLSKDPRPKELPDARQGRNSFGRIGYAGPAPPPGDGNHHYYFKVFALDEVLDVPDDVGRRDLLAAMKGHILAWGEIVGTYSRSRS